MKISHVPCEFLITASNIYLCYPNATDFDYVSEL
jgi:hypothetical protein